MKDNNISQEWQQLERMWHEHDARIEHIARTHKLQPAHQPTKQGSPMPQLPQGSLVSFGRQFGFGSLSSFSRMALVLAGLLLLAGATLWFLRTPPSHPVLVAESIPEAASSRQHPDTAAEEGSRTQSRAASSGTAPTPSAAVSSPLAATAAAGTPACCQEHAVSNETMLDHQVQHVSLDWTFDSYVQCLSCNADEVASLYAEMITNGLI